MTGSPSDTPPRYSLTRRRFAATLGAAAGLAAAPAIAQNAPKIVVIGGGAGGATAAKLIARDAPSARVTLVTASPNYTTCFFSNLYLAGFRSLQSLTFSYDRMKGHGVEVAVARAIGVDRGAKTVALSDGQFLPYDRLVLSPGIALSAEAIPGYDAAAAEIMPHAWQAGFQTFMLRRRIDAMKRGGVFVIAPPEAPYRCPPGPYERASMIALRLMRKNPRAKVLILDAKESFAKQALFESIWPEVYGDMIEWASSGLTGGVRRVDAQAGEIELGDGSRIKADAACIIPPQRAADIVLQAGLADETGWAPVDPRNMSSRFDPAVFVLGDSASVSPTPKSAFAASSQSRVAAQGVLNSLDLAPMFPARYRNTCWSFVAWQQVIKIGATYTVTDRGAIETASSFSSEIGETQKERMGSALEANGWYASLTSEMFA